MIFLYKNKKIVYNAYEIIIRRNKCMDKMRKYERLNLPNGEHLTIARHTVIDGHPQHWHSYFEIEIILSGSGKYIVNDVEYDIRENDVFFLTSTDFHYLEVDGVTELINISFDNHFFEERDMPHLFLNNVQNVYKLDTEEYERLLSAAKILLHEYETSGDCQKQLLQYIIKCLLRKNSSFYDKAGTGEQSRAVRNAIVYMEMHFAEKITLENVAAAAGYSATYFSDLFFRLTGESYIEALRKIRLGYAKSMLANGYCVSDACFLSGFGSLSNFLEVFKKHFKIPPSQYRKQSRAKR